MIRKTRPFAGRIGVVIGCLALIGTQTAALAANDTGIADFFARQFGIGESAPAPAPSWGDQQDEDRPLVVRPHRRRTAPRVAKIEKPKGPVTPVSIFEDPTLRRGDAVMTAHGIRIFRGSDSMPYREDDFVTVSNAGGLSRNVSKVLLTLDQAPRI